MSKIDRRLKAGLTPRSPASISREEWVDKCYRLIYDLSEERIKTSGKAVVGWRCDYNGEEIISLIKLPFRLYSGKSIIEAIDEFLITVLPKSYKSRPMRLKRLAKILEVNLRNDDMGGQDFSIAIVIHAVCMLAENNHGILGYDKVEDARALLEDLHLRAKPSRKAREQFHEMIEYTTRLARSKAGQRSVQIMGKDRIGKFKKKKQIDLISAEPTKQKRIKQSPQEIRTRDLKKPNKTEKLP